MLTDDWLTIGCHLAIPPRLRWLRPPQHTVALRSLPPQRLATTPTTPYPKRPTARWSSGWRLDRQGRRCSRWRWFPGRARSQREGRSDGRCFYAKYAHCSFLFFFYLQLCHLFCLFAFFCTEEEHMWHLTAAVPSLTTRTSGKFSVYIHSTFPHVFIDSVPSKLWNSLWWT